MSDLEPIWRGRFHFGDEPGVYADAQYVGLATEWPLTLRRFDPDSNSGGSLTLRLEAEDVRVFTQYAPGHLLSLFLYEPDPTADNPYRWRRTPINLGSSGRLTGDSLEVSVTLPETAATTYVGVRLEADTSVNPGLYDEFLVTRLSLASSTHYASFGFQYERNPRTDT